MKIAPMYEENPIVEIDGKAILLAEVEWGTEEKVPCSGDTFLKWNRVWKIVEMNPHTIPNRIKAIETVTT